MPPMPIILPVETQVRELDAKLLFACVAAERGIPTYLGFQNRIRNRITAFPRGLFLAKSFVMNNAKMFDIMAGLGHRIYAWDEEGLVHHPAPVYYDRRLSPRCLARMSGLFAWGRDQAELIKGYPHYDETPVYETGNPRIDLLRREVRPFYADSVAEIRERYGRFILVNSSFGTPNFTLGRLSPRQLGTMKELAASADYWKGQLEFRTRLFDLFREMVADLADRFPDRPVVLRPHPAENIETWRRMAADRDNLHVVKEGNVVPWMLAAEVMVHNGCMTAVECVLLDKPALAYQPLTSNAYDRHLPNAVSRQCFTLEELFDRVDGIVNGGDGADGVEALRPILDGYIRLDERRLAADLIMDVVQEVQDRPPPRRNGTAGGYAKAWYAAQRRALRKWIKSHRRDHRYATWHQKHQFPDLDVPEIEAKIGALRSALGRFEGVTARRMIENVFLIEGPK